MHCSETIQYVQAEELWGTIELFYIFSFLVNLVLRLIIIIVIEKNIYVKLNVRRNNCFICSTF